MTPRHSLLRMTVGITLLTALSAQAGPQPLTHHGFTTAGSVNVKVGQTNAGTTVNAAAGAFSVTWNGGTFATYCVELTQYAQLNKTHDYELWDGAHYFGTNYTPALGPDGTGAAVVDRLGRLFTWLGGMHTPVGGDHGSSSYTAAQVSAATQLAIWELIYEPGASWSLSNGTFSERTAGTSNGQAKVRTLADWMLDGAADVTERSYTVDVLRHASYQDYLVVRDWQPELTTLQGGSVPLPGTLALAVLGLAGMVVGRRAGVASV